MIKSFYAALALAASPLAATAQDEPRPRETTQVQAAEAPNVDPNASAESHLAFRASQLMNMSVRNAENEEIASIKDFVVDVQTGKIRYVAVSYGGLAGFGDKLFAIPLNQFRVVKDAEDDEYYFSTSIPVEKLKNAPGFDADKWPAVASQAQWTAEVDKYYGDDADRDATPRVDRER